MRAMRIPVLIAAEVDRELVDRMRRDERFEVRYLPSRTENELIARVPGARVLVTRHYNAITARVLGAAREAELIVQGTSGLDNIDASATSRGIQVAGVPGENANAVAELVLGFMIALTRTVPAYDRMVRAGVWKRDDCSTRSELRAHPLGIIGLGRVGSRVVSLAAAFGMEARAYDPYLSAEEIRSRGAEKEEQLDDLLARSRILTVHVPLTAETSGMIGEREIALLPTAAFVINTARGAVIDPDALVAAVLSGHLAGIALDVFEDEPPEVGWPDDPRILLTPHIAGCSRESKRSIGRAVYRIICERYGFEPIS